MNAAMLINNMISQKSCQKKIAFWGEIEINAVIDKVKEEYITYSPSILEESTSATGEMHY